MKMLHELFWIVESDIGCHLLYPSQDHTVYSIPARGVSGETGEFTQLPDHGMWHHRHGHGQRIPAGWGDRSCRVHAAVPQVRGPASGSGTPSSLSPAVWGGLLSPGSVQWLLPLSLSLSHMHTDRHVCISIIIPVSWDNKKVWNNSGIKCHWCLTLCKKNVWPFS